MRNLAVSMVVVVTSDEGTGTNVTWRGSSTPKNVASCVIRRVSMAVTYSIAFERSTITA